VYVVNEKQTSKIHVSGKSALPLISSFINFATADNVDKFFHHRLLIAQLLKGTTCHQFTDSDGHNAQAASHAGQKYTLDPADNSSPNKNK
jgi:hypothetical protein